jgi:acyl carrier protein
MSDEQRLVDCFKRVFPDLPEDEIRDANMKRLGVWNSAKLLSLVTTVEKAFHVRFDLDTINTFTSFTAMLNAVRSGGSSPVP